MELRQLVYFEMVARSGGFTRAAEQLHVAQPAISAQVRNLEHELGTNLFDRTTRSVRLTHAGTVLLARARTVLAELDGARADLDDLAEVLRGRLRLGVTQVLGPIDLPSLLAGFHRSYPEVTLTVCSGLVADLLTELDDDSVDAVIAPVHDGLPRRFAAQPVGEERVVLITPRGHLSTRARTVTLAAVRDDPFVCLSRTSGLYALLTAAAADQGFEPTVPFEAPDPFTVRSFVAAGLGVAVIAASAAGPDGPAVDVYRFRGAPAHPPIGLIRRRANSSRTLRAWTQHVLATHPPTRDQRR